MRGLLSLLRRLPIGLHLDVGEAEPGPQPVSEVTIGVLPTCGSPSTALAVEIVSLQLLLALVALHHERNNRK